jgi:hypothetical protein
MIRITRPIAAGSLTVRGSEYAMKLHRITVTAEAHVPGPGRRRPMPKKEARSMDHKEVRAGFDFDGLVKRFEYHCCGALSLL